MFIAEFRLNPLLIGAHCEPPPSRREKLPAGLNPLLIGAHCERSWYGDHNLALGLNPLLIGAHCEHALPSMRRGDDLSQSPFDRGSL